MSQGYILATPERVDRLRDVINNRTIIAAPRQRMHVVAASGENTFLAKITSHISFSPNRWKYGFEEVAIVLVDGEPAAGLVEDGRTNLSLGAAAYNLYELNNTETGVQGNSIDLSTATFPPEFRLQPVGGNRDGTVPENEVIVRLRQQAVLSLVQGDDGETLEDTGKTILTFAYPNAVDGVCS